MILIRIEDHSCQGDSDSTCCSPSVCQYQRLKDFLDDPEIKTQP